MRNDRMIRTAAEMDTLPNGTVIYNYVTLERGDQTYFRMVNGWWVPCSPDGKVRAPSLVEYEGKFKSANIRMPIWVCGGERTVREYIVTVREFGIDKPSEWQRKVTAGSYDEALDKAKKEQ